MSRCRYCYQTGHNQRTCPKKTAALKKRHDFSIEAGETDSYWIRQYQERIAPKGKKASQQTCGYCRERGHTRRKCEALKGDMDWFVQHHNEHVRVAHDYIVNSPVGLGSLFRQKTKDYDYNTSSYVNIDTLLVLTDFVIPLHTKKCGFAINATLTDPATGRSVGINVRDYVINPDYTNGSWNRVKMVAPSRETMPSGWIAEQTITIAQAKNHDYFKRTGRKNDDARKYDFIRIDSMRGQANKPNTDGGFDYAARAREELSSYTAAHNRAKIFEDFKSGQ